MANKKILMRMLVLVLVFGGFVVGCISIPTQNDGSPQTDGRGRITIRNTENIFGHAYYVHIRLDGRSMGSMFIVGDNGTNIRESSSILKFVNASGEYSIHYCVLVKDSNGSRPSQGLDSSTWPSKTVFVPSGARVEVTIP